jgi:SHS2 domain-containing protein
VLSPLSVLEVVVVRLPGSGRTRVVVCSTVVVSIDVTGVVVVVVVVSVDVVSVVVVVVVVSALVVVVVVDVVSATPPPEATAAAKATPATKSAARAETLATVRTRRSWQVRRPSAGGSGPSPMRHPPRVRDSSGVTTYRFLEHGGEVELALRAATEVGVFDAALRAFRELVADGEEGEEVRHEVELGGDDRALLLVDWLSELVFLAEAEQFVPERLAAAELRGDRLCATVVGRRAQPRPLVKAVTLEHLEFRQAGGTWHGRVVLDV